MNLRTLTCISLLLLPGFCLAEELSVPSPHGGRLSVIVDFPKGAGPFPALVLAPGQGYHMNLPALEETARSVVAQGVAVFRFNWAYFTARPKGRPSATRLIDELPTPVTLFAALGCGLIAGVFFAFSNFVMKALDRTQGISAMQSINVLVLNPLFLGVFVGTAIACGFLGIHSLLHWQSPGSVYRLAGSALYLLGTFGVTAAFNVPLNNILARVDASQPEALHAWRGYVASWTRWNHVRTAAALAAAAALTIAL